MYWVVFSVIGRCLGGGVVTQDVSYVILFLKPKVVSLEVIIIINGYCTLQIGDNH